MPLGKLICNSLTQPHFDYACSAWYRKLNKRLKSKMQILQNKCTSFYLNLNNRARVGQNEFEKINWLPIKDRLEQIISSVSFKFCNNTSLPYMNDVFKPAGQSNTTTRASSLKLNQTLRRNNQGHKNISYIAPIFWNNIPNSLKITENLNTLNTVIHLISKNVFVTSDDVFESFVDIGLTIEYVHLVERSKIWILRFTLLFFVFIP